MFNFAVVRNYNLFGLEFKMDNVAFRLGSFEVYWYGIIIALGFALAIIYGMKNAKRFNINTDHMLDVIIVGLIGAIVCARAYYLIFDGEPLPGSFKGNLSYIFGIHNGGIAIYGGIIGAFLFGGLTAYLRKIKLFDMFDLAALGFLIGQGIGRWGNFFNQEVYGMPTGSSWFGIAGDSIGKLLVHPLFLYESVLCIVAFFVLHKVSKKRQFAGQIFLLYLAIYSFGRYWLEGMRQTEFILMAGQMSISQFVAIILFIASVIAYIIMYRKSLSFTNEEEYVSQFGSMYDDPAMLDAGYALLGCEWDASDDALTSAYEELKAKYTAMLPDDQNEQSEKLKDMVFSSDAPVINEDGTVEISDEELAIRAKAKISELDEAYDYIMNNRRLSAEQTALFESARSEIINSEEVKNDN